MTNEGGRRVAPALVWVEAHLVSVLMAVFASTLLAFFVEGVPRVPALDWGADAMPFGMRTLSIALIASVVMTVPVGGVVLVPGLACQWLARRLGGHAALHGALAVPASLLATAFLFGAGGVAPGEVPPLAFAINAGCAVLGGFVFRHVLVTREAGALAGATQS